jgi:hypothetical protein
MLHLLHLIYNYILQHENFNKLIMKKHLFASAMLFAGLCVNAQSQRMSLYEEFTGETCPPCASANPALNALLLSPINEHRVAAIKWQVPIPTASSKSWSLYQTNRAEIDWRYKLSGYGYGINSAPSGKMDGQNVTVFGASSSHPNSMNNAVITTAVSYTSAFDIQMERSWESDLSAINVVVTVKATAPFSAVGNLMFRTVMIERLIQFSVQPGTNGEKVFEDVAIASFPTTKSGTVVTGMGTALPATWTLGQVETFTLNCPVPSYTRKLTEIAFVGFIQDDGNKKVQQAFRLERQGIEPNDARVTTVEAPEVTCTSNFEPIATIHNNGITTITSMVLTPYLDGVAGTPINYNGNFENGSSMTVTFSPVTSNVAGGHEFKVEITNVSGGDNNTLDNELSTVVYMGNGTKGKTVTQDFETVKFPPALWQITNANHDVTWSHASGTDLGGYATSASSIKYAFYNNKVLGDKDELFLPPANLYGGADPDLTYEWAYAPTPSTNDKLEILASDDCGLTWKSFYSATGNNLASTATTPVGEFIPNASEHWSFNTVKLTGMNKLDVIVKFVVTNGNGNNLYIDNVNLLQSDPQEPPPPNPTGIAETGADGLTAGVFPNPTSGAATVRIGSPVSGEANISVTNLLGQVVFTKAADLKSGTNEITLDLSSVPAGIYNVTVECGDSSISKKLTINK